MPSHEYEDFIAPFRGKGTFGPELTISELRTRFEMLAANFFKPANGAEHVPTQIAGLVAEWIYPQGCDRTSVVLFLHGGGYGIGSIDTHRGIAGNIAVSAGVAGLVIEYRLAPEHTYPAAIDDAISAYSALLAKGFASDRIVVAGDSAGGGMALSLLMAARDRALPLPAGAVCLSPLTDLTHSGESVTSRASRDPFVSESGSRAYAHRYLGSSGDPHDPLASPLFGNFAGLPPILLLVGSEEVLHDDSTRVAAKLKAHGNTGAFEIWPDMIHVWPMFYEHYPEAKKAIARIGDFVSAAICRANK
ncbi:alpha/beta hydrolase [Sphingobium sp. 3R8]|uniref:alpha/beta hydrolase n=1 Tax=Sphingobium sp. 3R8 TaxID=2874921 RepID=UPI001CCE2EE3|nr:alpha/beta hydrolase [Sphingobium sp. 3R8]MBZ9646900.1 alpha/beta hydrolase [Sphingobium sp. 3R8]